MDKVQELLKTAQNRLLRARTETVIGADTPAAQAVDTARKSFTDLIKYLGGDSSVHVPNLGKALQNLCTTLQPFNTDPNVKAAHMDLLEAEMLVADTTDDA
jgi:hypothetical protein